MPDKDEVQVLCERCGEPAGNEPVCGTCLAREAAEKAEAEEAAEE